MTRDVEPPAALSAAISALSGEIRAMRTDVAALTQGLMLMAESEEAQGEMLMEILRELSREGPEDSPMEALVASLTRALDRLTEAQKETANEVMRLRSQLVTAILRNTGPPDPEADQLEPPC